MYYSTRAFILTSVPFGERGKIFTFLTEQKGLVYAQGQGVMPARTKLGSSLTPYRMLSVTCASRANERIIGVEVKETYKNIWTDLRRQGYAAWANAFLAACLKPEAEDIRIFSLIRDYYHHIDECSLGNGTLPLLRVAFAMRLIRLLGYHLPLHADDIVYDARDANRPPTLEELAARITPHRHEAFQSLEKWNAEMDIDITLPARYLMSLKSL